MDSVLQNIIVTSLNYANCPSDLLISVSETITSNKSLIDEIQDSFTNASKFVINPYHMKFIIKYDSIADSYMTKKERYMCLKNWNTTELLQSENLSRNTFYVDHLQSVLDSEIELSLGCDKDPMKLLYHRTRSFAHSLLFCLKEEFIEFITNDTIKYIFYCSLAAVIMDDAEDIDEDTLNDSPTIFSVQNSTDASNQALSVIGMLENVSIDFKNEIFQIVSSSLTYSCTELQTLKGDSLLNIFLCLGLAKTLDIVSGHKSHAFNTRKYLYDCSKIK